MKAKQTRKEFFKHAGMYSFVAGIGSTFPIRLFGRPDHRIPDKGEAVVSTRHANTDEAGVDLEDFVPRRSLRVSTLAQLEAAFTEAQPGDLIELAEGEYVTNQPILARNIMGRPDAPIVIRSAQHGKVRIAGTAGFHLKQSAYVVLEGFDMVHKTTYSFLVDGCHHTRVRGNRVSLVETDENYESREVFDWVKISGAHSYKNRIDHNLIENKRTRGVMVQVSGAGVDLRNEASKFDRIDHNHFRNFEQGEGNGYETLRLGRSLFSHSSGYTLVDHNLFEECSGEIEIISVKSNDHSIRNNTFLNCGGEITLRNCHRILVEGNFMLNPAGVETANGVRAYGTGHRIVNNYFQGLTGPAILIRTGDIERRWRSEWMFRDTYGEDFDWSVWGGYQIPVDIQVAHNTAVDCKQAILIGDSRKIYPHPPRGIQIANNIFQVNHSTMIQVLSNPEDWHWARNIFYSTAEHAELGMDLAAHEAKIVDPRFITDGAIKRLHPQSPAIGAGSTLREMLQEDTQGHTRGARLKSLRGKKVVTHDIHGQPRTDAPTIGAEEVINRSQRLRPLTPSDVGPYAYSI